MNFDLTEFKFGTLYIDGILKIDTSNAVTTIKANNIWVRGGSLVNGENIDYPPNNKLNIELYGNRYSPPIVIDDVSRTGTKSFAVTGTVNLFGIVPKNT